MVGSSRKGPQKVICSKEVTLKKLVLCTILLVCVLLGSGFAEELFGNPLSHWSSILCFSLPDPIYVDVCHGHEEKTLVPACSMSLFPLDWNWHIYLQPLIPPQCRCQSHGVSGVGDFPQDPETRRSTGASVKASRATHARPVGKGDDQAGIQS